MLFSLSIHDESATMSPGDSKSLVDLINTQLPNLRVFAYRAVTNTTGPLRYLSRSLQRTCAKAIRAIQPFVGLNPSVRTALDLPIPPILASRNPQLYSGLCEVRLSFVDRNLQMVVRLRKYRYCLRARHVLALKVGSYLHVTRALRSQSDPDTQPKINIKFEEILDDMHTFGLLMNEHRRMLRAAREAERATR